MNQGRLREGPARSGPVSVACSGFRACFRRLTNAILRLSCSKANHPLFEGLSAADNWEWSKARPVIRESFGDGVGKDPAILPVRLREILAANARRLGLDLAGGTVVGDFGDLMERTAQRYGRKVVLLIDEYDKPILDNIENAEVATAMRDGLRDFHSVAASWRGMWRRRLASPGCLIPGNIAGSVDHQRENLRNRALPP